MCLQAEHIQKKRQAERLERKQRQRQLSVSPGEQGGQRRETWVSSDGHSSCDQICDNDSHDDDITKLTNTEVSGN